jgi:HSP20 family protein
MLSITRRDPFRSLSALQEQVNRLFEDTFFRGSDEAALTAWAPSVDIYETEQELVLRADLPGLTEKDIDLRIENNMLTIRGERQFEKNVKEENYLRVERAFGSFSRSFTLPNTVNPDAIKAEYKDGVLTVTLPKREESKPRQVKISVSSNGK